MVSKEELINSFKDTVEEPVKPTNYAGKKFSILGDSTSTMIGVIPDEYKPFYNNINCAMTNVHCADDTWWGRVIKNFEGELLANSSYSGSGVTSPNGMFPCINSNERIEALSNDGVDPDVVIVYAGFNDWVKGKPLKAINNGKSLTEFFDFSYLNIILKIKNRFPNTEIWCCTLCKTAMSSKENFVFPSQRYGVELDEFNNVIRTVAKHDNCKLLDLYALDEAIDTADSSHPNDVGMKTLSSLVCQEASKFVKIIEEECDDFGEDEEFDQDEEFEPILELTEETNEEPEKEDDNIYCPKCNKKVEKNNKFCMSCGAKLDFDATKVEDEIVDLIDNRYELRRQIGKGASSVVYLAKDIKLDRVCAVKIVNKNTYKDIVAAQESLDEVNKLKQLAHVSIPQLYDIYDDDKRLCIVMEFIDGRNLRELLSVAKQPIDEKTIVNWAKQICRVLYYLHTLNPPRVYRDLKPSNIILQSNGIIKLIDFGTMKNFDESESEDTVNLGTKGYAAPEQFGGRGATDPRTDLYAFGMTLFHLITGVSPAKAPYDIKPVRAYRTDISEQLENIVLKCIKIEREERYQSAMEILFDLEKIK